MTLYRWLSLCEKSAGSEPGPELRVRSTSKLNATEAMKLGSHRANIGATEAESGRTKLAHEAMHEADALSYHEDVTKKMRKYVRISRITEEAGNRRVVHMST